MEFINYMRDVFSSDYARDDGELLEEKPLHYEEDFHLQYVDWLLGEEPYKIVKEVYRAYGQRLNGMEKRDPCITFLTVPTVNGFTMHYEDCRWTQDDLRFFFEYLANTLTEHLDYEQKEAMSETTQYEDRRETVERYQLVSTSEEADYCEILLRLCYTDNAISSLKFCAVRTKRRIAKFEELLAGIATA